MAYIKNLIYYIIYFYLDSNMKNKYIVVAFFCIALLFSLSLSIESPIPQNGTVLGLEFHVDMWHRRNGKLLAYSHHVGNLTNIGANFTKEKISYDSGNLNATYIALSNSTDSPSATWTDLPAEITTGNMSRAQGSYTDTGVGTWNVSYIFSPTETNSTRLVGLLWNTGASVLLASDTITPVNYENGDTLEIVWSITVS